MTRSRRDLHGELDQLILAGTEVIRAHNPVLAEFLDKEPPPVTARIESSSGPMIASGPLLKVKIALLRIKVLHPVLKRMRAILLRLRR